MLWKNKAKISSSGLTSSQSVLGILKDLIKLFEYFLEKLNLNPYVT